MSKNFNEVANFIWSIAELLRDYYKRGKYSDVILPFTVLRRLDCVLEPTKDNVLEKYDLIKDKLDDPSGQMRKASGYSFYNVSPYDFQKLLDDPQNIKENIFDYLNGYSDNIQEIIEKFKLREQVNNLSEKNLLYKVVQRFSEVDMHPDEISNHEMGYVFEELIRKFNEQSNENPGEHFTPREIIKLMVNLLMVKDQEELSIPGKSIHIYDPACGTGGMLTIAKEHILGDINPKAEVEMFGQEINDETFAICKSDMLIKGENADNIKYGSSFSNDGLKDMKFDYILSNPPYGKDWKQEKEYIENESEMGTVGRFHAGLPRKDDGQLLFLQHMISKMHENEEITRIAIVFNGSPLFSGDAGSGESEIRRWVIENDWLETIIALPNQLFYNTGISTYIWILTNHKEEARKGKIALLNAVDMYKKMKKSLGDKRNKISDSQIHEIIKIYIENLENGRLKILDSSEFGYRKIIVDRPLRMNFIVSSDRISKIYDQTAFKNLTKIKKNSKTPEKDFEDGIKLQKQIIKILEQMDEHFYNDWSEFEKILVGNFAKSDIKLNATIKKAIRAATGEIDQESEIIKNNKGIMEFNSDLRDYERVPLADDINEYFEKEVTPFVADAWISEHKDHIDKKDGLIGKVGYEINFNKYFYKYEAPRELTDVNKDIEILQKDIFDILREVME